jgi:fibronectin-binding autotransporter adhesin
MFRSFLKTVFSQSTSKQTKRPSQRLKTRLWLEVLEDRLVPSGPRSLVWNGAGPDNLASDAQNWSGGQLPTSVDTIVFNNTSSKPATIDGAFTNIVAGMQISADYNSTVSLAEDLAVTAAFAQSGSTLAGANNLVLKGAATFTAGTQTGSGTTIIDVAGSATYSGPATVTFDGRGLTIAAGGTATVSGGQLVAQNGVIITNNGTLGLQGGNVTLAGGCSLNGTGQTTISSAGLLTTSGSVDGSQQFVENDGTINVTSGTLMLGNGASSGTFDVVSGALLQFNSGTFNANGGTQFADQGRVKVGGGQQAVTFNLAGQVVSLGIFTLDANATVQNQNPATLTIQGAFEWNRGTVRRSAIIRIAPNTVANIAPASIYLLDSATLLNQGTLNMVGDTFLELDGTLDNYGTIVITTALNEQFQANGFGTIRNRLGAQIQKTGVDSARLQSTNFYNDGVITTSAGTLRVTCGSALLGGGGTNTGYFQAAAGTTVLFDGDLVFDPVVNQTSGYMLRGDGLYTQIGAGSLAVVAGGTVTANNFEMRAGLTGAGTFAANNFYWTYGVMYGSGVTLVPANRNMYITQSATPQPHRIEQQRTLLNEGRIDWGTAQDMPDRNIIDVSDQGTIVNDNEAHFEIHNNQTIRAGATAGPFVLRNSAYLHKDQLVGDGSTIIQLQVQNNGGIIYTEGNVELTNSLTQTLATAQTTIAGPRFTAAGVLYVESGLLSLNGGVLQINQPTSLGGVVIGSNATFQGSGQISGAPLRNYGTVQLQGNLTVSDRVFQETGTTNLGGFTLTSNGPSILIDGGTVNLQTGTLACPTTNGRISNAGTIYGQGNLNAASVTNRQGGRIFIRRAFRTVGIAIQGDFVAEAGSTLSFDVAGKQLGTDYSQLTITGNATFAGQLQVNLLNGFVPSLTNPDTFQIITFASSSGHFDQQSIDIGGGLFLDVTYDPHDVTLVTAAS